MGFVKYSLQYVIIILTFVGVSLCFRSILVFWITSATLKYIEGDLKIRFSLRFSFLAVCYIPIIITLVFILLHYMLKCAEIDR